MMLRRVLIVLGAMLMWVIVGAAPAQAQTQARRFAVVIGSNLGDDNDIPLKYAERDAQRVADVLMNMGNVARQDLVILMGSNAQTVEHTLNALNEQIAALPKKSLLFVFYSGHADVNSLHLAGTRLGFAKLRSQLETSPAVTKLLVIDACRSGGVTRVKGGRPAKPFALEAQQWQVGSGIAVITSATSGEDAQESERLKGSFFTHYFVSGLMGAADDERDGDVTLNEVYDYAYNETIRATSSAAVIQHPTFAFDLKGRQELVLTRMHNTREGVGAFEFQQPGVYVIFDEDAKGAIVAEVRVDGPTVIGIPEGGYFIRRRRDGALYEGYLPVVENETTYVNDAFLSKVPTAQVARKGGAEARVAWGFVTGAGMIGEVVPDTSMALTGHIGVQTDMRAISFQARFRYGLTNSANQTVAIRQDLLGFDLAVLSIFDIASFNIGGGLRLGADMFLQRFEGVDESPRRSLVPRASAVLTTGWAVATWISIYVEGSADVYWVQTQAARGDGISSFRLTPAAVAGLVFYL